MKVFAVVMAAVAIVLLAIIFKASWETGYQIGFKAGLMEAETYYTQASQLQAQEYEAKLAEQKATTESIRTALHESITREYYTSEEARELSEDLEAITLDLEQSRTFGGLVQFDSKLELHQWLQNNPVSTRPYVDGSYVCSNYALDLCIDAWNDGYLMGLSRISDQRHQRAFTIIGKTIYEIEAITDGVREVGSVY